MREPQHLLHRGANPLPHREIHSLLHRESHPLLRWDCVPHVCVGRGGCAGSGVPLGTVPALSWCGEVSLGDIYIILHRVSNPLMLRDPHPLLYAQQLHGADNRVL